jgi:type IV pilus assembly protein PilP
MKHLLSLAAAGTLLLGLAACSNDNEELLAWMQEEHKAVKPSVAPVYPPKKFDPQPYIGAAGVDPFGAQKLVAATGSTSHESSALLARAQGHKAEPLEAYPLDAMTMVGSMVQGGRAVALLNVENRIENVHVGEYIGQNYGLITKISENEVTLRETVQDATGEWIERTSSLQLQEKAR